MSAEHQPVSPASTPETSSLQEEVETHPLVRVFELGEKLISEGKLTPEEFSKKIEPLGYEGPNVGP